MKVESLTSSGSHLILKGVPTIHAGGAEGKAAPKSIGETPPVILELKDIGKLAAFFAPTGLLGRLRKRLNHLKRKNLTIVPAKGNNACVDDEDTVYFGVDLLQEFIGDEETIAGILAHEWGHSCALKPTQEDMEKLNWNQIFDLRRAHETLADEICGRLLFMMGYSPQGVINFLMRGKDTHNLKYHHPEIRGKVIQYGYQCEKRKAELARSLFPNATYKDEYKSILLDIA